jgi:hypothetical protein
MVATRRPCDAGLLPGKVRNIKSIQAYTRDAPVRVETPSPERFVLTPLLTTVIEETLL